MLRIERTLRSVADFRQLYLLFAIFSVLALPNDCYTNIRLTTVANTNCHMHPCPMTNILTPRVWLV